MINNKKMLQLDFLKKSGFFKEFHLEKNEVLFEQWEKDQHIYIIITWELEVQRYTTINKVETKTLAILWSNEVFWEASLNSDKPKEVKIIATKKSLLIWINAQEWLDSLTQKYPNEAMNLLKYIIHSSNKRINEWNSLITANYKVTQEILKIKEVNNKNIFSLIDKLEEITHIDYTFFLEKNPVLDNYLVQKYDSRNKGKMLDNIIEITDNKLELLELKIQDTYSEIQELTIWDKLLGYLIYFRKNEEFKDNDIKVLTTISTGIAWLIKEKSILEEQRDIDFMEN